MASEVVAKRAWLVRTPTARVPPAETDPLAQRLIEEQPDAVAYVGPHGEYWYDCVVDSIVDFKITLDVDFPVVPACWCATDEDARQILSMFVNDPSEIEVVETLDHGCSGETGLRTHDGVVDHVDPTQRTVDDRPKNRLVG